MCCKEFLRGNRWNYQIIWYDILLPFYSIYIFPFQLYLYIYTILYKRTLHKFPILLVQYENCFNFLNRILTFFPFNCVFSDVPHTTTVTTVAPTVPLETVPVVIVKPESQNTKSKYTLFDYFLLDT